MGVRKKQASPPPTPTEMSRAAVVRALKALREYMDANPAVPIKREKAIVESSGPINPDLGEALRVLQIHITHLMQSEQDALFALTSQVMARLKLDQSR